MVEPVRTRVIMCTDGAVVVRISENDQITLDGVHEALEPLGQAAI